MHSLSVLSVIRVADFGRRDGQAQRAGDGAEPRLLSISQLMFLTASRTGDRRRLRGQRARRLGRGRRGAGRSARRCARWRRRRGRGRRRTRGRAARTGRQRQSTGGKEQQAHRPLSHRCGHGAVYGVGTLEWGFCKERCAAGVRTRSPIDAHGADPITEARSMERRWASSRSRRSAARPGCPERHRILGPGEPAWCWGHRPDGTDDRAAPGWTHGPVPR